MAFLSLGKVKTAALQTIAGSTLPIAIDFGVGSLKALQLASGEPPQLIGAAALETPEALRNDPARRLAFQLEALPKFIRSAGFKGRRAVCSIPAGQTFIKHMQFPKNESVDVADLVRAAIPSALNCVPEALVLRHYLVDGAQAAGSGGSGPQGGAPGGPRQEVICLAASRELVGRVMGSIREAKLECVGIQPECIAAVKAFEHINRRAGDEHVATLYLDLACGTTKVWITHGNTLVFAKTIQMGGNELDAAVARAMDLDVPSARARRLAASVLVAPAATPQGASMATGGMAILAAAMAREGAAAEPAPGETATAEERRVSGTAPGLTARVNEQPAAAVAPPEFDLGDQLETLTDEVAMCLRYYESMFPGRRLDRAIFFGGEARHRGLCQHVARKVRIPAHVADPLARMGRTGKESVLGVDFTTPQPGWTVPFGLSLCPTDL